MGTLHAWQSYGDNVSPDIQAVAKGLGGGYVPDRTWTLAFVDRPYAQLRIDWRYLDIEEGGRWHSRHVRLLEARPYVSGTRLLV